MDNKGKTKYQQQQKAGNKPSSGRQSSNAARPNTLEASEKARSRELADEIDGRFGFHRMVEVSRRHVTVIAMDSPDTERLSLHRAPRDWAGC